MSLLVRFQDTITKQHLFFRKDKLLLAVSGGVDSVVLCELCRQAGYDFIIAHCNFRLRGEESERDENFVRKLGEKYGVAVKIKGFDTEKYATENKISIQEAARTLRYEWFEMLVNEEFRKEPVYLLTAHHRDDNIETLLMNFFRGTGLHGLTGIPVSFDHVKRPLLSFSKEELVQFAKEFKLDYVEDSSNLSSKYTRNFFRHEIIPAISKVYPQVKENLQDNINRFKGIEKLYKFSVRQIIEKLCRKKGTEVHIPVKQLMQYDNRALIYEIISKYGFNEKQVDEVIKLATSDSGKYMESPTLPYRIIRHRHWFIISPVQSAEAGIIVIEEKESNIGFEAGKLQIELSGKKASDRTVSGDTACLDAKGISFPMVLRKWKTGDYFYPLGMKKKKKLSRFFIDQKLSKSEKENTWVIESDKKIIWVLGHRIDERFKITDNTKNTLRLTLTRL